MKEKYLLPYYFKKIGWLLLIPGLVLGLIYLYDSDLSLLEFKVWTIASDESMRGNTKFFKVILNDLTDEIASILMIVGALFIAFSKEKVEDELISTIRLESLVLATYVNYVVLLLTILFTYGLVFFWVLVFNMFTLLLFFILFFKWSLYKSRNSVIDEE